VLAFPFQRTPTLGFQGLTKGPSGPHGSLRLDSSRARMDRGYGQVAWMLPAKRTTLLSQSRRSAERRLSTCSFASSKLAKTRR